MAAHSTCQPGRPGPNSDGQDGSPGRCPSHTNGSIGSFLPGRDGSPPFSADSLIILDEIGRGTSTFDGMSIARAVIEYIKDKIKAKTLFATHYHELTELEKDSKRLKNFSVAVKERGNEVVFLRRIVPGGADKSYGIHVAQLAGLPKKVIERAQDILADLEQSPRPVAAAGEAAATTSPAAAPLSLFASSLAEELLVLDIMTLTPLEALNILYKLQHQAKQEAGKA